MDFSWAEQYPEVHKVCEMFQISEVSMPVDYCYTPLKAYLQDGPQCGLVALAMCLKSPIKETVDRLLESAKNLGFSFNGEMFSVEDMADLTRVNFGLRALVIIHRGTLNDENIITHLMEDFERFTLTGPRYDTDRNNSPGLYRGHKAHWAAVSGVIKTEKGCYVLARHGKSKNVGIWSLEKLAESNKQLYEFSPDRKQQNLQYKLPKEGIGGPLGLNEKSVLIKFS